MTHLDKVYGELGYEPAVDRASEVELERIEGRLGRQLPAAVREWYSKQGAVKLMASRTSDHPRKVDELGSPVPLYYGRGTRDFLSEGLLFVMTENQSVCDWAVDLADSDDPRVLVAMESRSDLVWQLHSPHFSEWLYCVLTDWGPKGCSSLCAQDVELSGSDLEWLRANFDSGPITYAWPCPVNYRFGHLDQHILIWSCAKQCDWQLSAVSEASLKELACSVWGRGDLSNTLYGTDEVSESVLDALRRKSIVDDHREGP